MITDKDGNKKLIPIVDNAAQQQQSEQQDHQENSEEVTAQTCHVSNQPVQTSGQVSTSTTLRKPSSLSIIFRKVIK